MVAKKTKKSSAQKQSRRQYNKVTATPAPTDFISFSHPKTLAALCVLALLLAAGGLHLAYAGGDANRYLLMDHSHLIAHYYRLSLAHDFPLPAQLQEYNFLFPDYLMQLLLSRLFDSPYAAVHAYAFLCMVVMAVSCMLLTRRLWGTHFSWLALPLAGLPALLLVYGGEELFVTMAATSFRTGLLALQPLLLWLTLGVLFAPSARPLKIYAAALFVVLFFLHMSYTIIMTWFVAPIILATLFSAWRGWLPPQSSNWQMFAAVMLVSYLCAKVAREPVVALFFEGVGANTQATDISFSWRGFQLSLTLMLKWLADFVLRYPLLSVLWAAFVALLGYALRCGARPSKQHHNGIFYCAAAFLLLAVLLPPAAAVVLGKFGIWGRIEHFANHRYFEPSVYLPLFFGWSVLLGFFLPRWRGSFSLPPAADTWLATAFAGVVVCLSLPLLRHTPQVAALAGYSSPFLECVQDNAEKHNLKQGFASPDFAAYLSAHGTTSAGTMKALGVINIKKLAAIQGQKFAADDFPFKFYARVMPSGITKTDFNYVVLNWTDEAKLLKAPELARCPRRLQNPQHCLDEGKYGRVDYNYIDDETVTAYYGAPISQFRCFGVDFYVYAQDLNAGKLSF